jgi:hypothetical protein
MLKHDEAVLPLVVEKEKDLQVLEKAKEFEKSTSTTMKSFGLNNRRKIIPALSRRGSLFQLGGVLSDDSKRRTPSPLTFGTSFRFSGGKSKRNISPTSSPPTNSRGSRKRFFSQDY